LEETKLLKNSKSDSRAFLGPKAGKSAYFTHPDFSAAKLEKKSAQITRVNTVLGTTSLNIPENKGQGALLVRGA
jgi:hypothetical protein